MSTIEAMTSRAVELRRAIDLWNCWMLGSLIVTALAAFIIVITTRKQLFLAKQLDDVQTQLLQAKEAQLSSNLKDKDVKIAEANERANIAALELAKFKAPRSLSADQSDRVMLAMKRFTGTEFDGGVGPLNDPEPLQFFDQVAAALSAAGWKQIAYQTQTVMTLPRSNKTPPVGAVSVTNVFIDIHPQQALRLRPVALALAEALAAEGISVAVDEGSGGGSTNAEAIHILVGRKM